MRVLFPELSHFPRSSGFDVYRRQQGKGEAWGRGEESALRKVRTWCLSTGLASWGVPLPAAPNGAVPTDRAWSSCYCP